MYKRRGQIEIDTLLAVIRLGDASRLGWWRSPTRHNVTLNRPKELRWDTCYEALVARIVADYMDLWVPRCVLNARRA